ncbi:uncharacterized protein LOC144136750 [Amblyomma americanum]
MDLRSHYPEYLLRPGFYALDVQYLPYLLLSAALVTGLAVSMILCLCAKRRKDPRPQTVAPHTAVAVTCATTLHSASLPEIVLCPPCEETSSCQEDCLRREATAAVHWNQSSHKSTTPSPHFHLRRGS